MEAIDRTYHFKKTLEKKERFVGGQRAVEPQNRVGCRLQV